MKPRGGDGAEQRKVGKVTPGGEKSRNRAWEACNAPWGLWAQGEGESGIWNIRKGEKRRDAKIRVGEHPEESCADLEVSAGHLTVWSLDHLHQNLPGRLHQH